MDGRGRVLEGTRPPAFLFGRHRYGDGVFLRIALGQLREATTGVIDDQVDGGDQQQDDEGGEQDTNPRRWPSG